MEQPTPLDNNNLDNRHNCGTELNFCEVCKHIYCKKCINLNNHNRGDAYFNDNTLKKFKNLKRSYNNLSECRAPGCWKDAERECSQQACCGYFCKGHATHSHFNCDYKNCTNIAHICVTVNHYTNEQKWYCSTEHTRPIIMHSMSRL